MQCITLTSITAFAVNGSGIPNIDFDVGESYAGALSISSNASDENALWFWFFPSDNPDASDEITVSMTIHIRAEYTLIGPSYG